MENLKFCLNLLQFFQLFSKRETNTVDLLFFLIEANFSFCSLQPINLSKCTLSLHIFHLNEEKPSTENLEEENEDIVAANHWVLPAGTFLEWLRGSPE